MALFFTDMVGERRHLHFGPGKLGMGLIAWRTGCGGMAVTFATTNERLNAGHKNPALLKSSRYFVESGDLQEVRIRGMGSYTETSFDGVLLDAIADPDTVLLTTSLGPHLKDAVAAISELLMARHASGVSSELFVVAAENTHDSIWLKTRIEAYLSARLSEIPLAAMLEKVTFIRCVVDRICRNVVVTGDSVVVSAGTPAHWRLEDLAGASGDVLKSILPSDSVVEYVSNIEFEQRLKLYLFNGPHLLLAIFAYLDNVAFLPDYLNTEIGRRVFARVFYECRSMFLAVEPLADLNRVLSEIRDNISRFAAERDTVSRILYRLTVEREVVSFLEDFHYKVGLPTLSYMRARGRNLQIIPLALFSIIERIQQPEFPTIATLSV